MLKNLGGNLIKSVKLNRNNIFYSNEYHFSFHVNPSSLLRALVCLKSFVLIPLNSTLEVEIDNENFELSEGSFVYVDGINRIDVLNLSQCLLCGSSFKNIKKGIKVGMIQGQKVVKKPWGKEYWIHLGEKFCLKLLSIKGEERTSLQFHDLKVETHYIHKGELELSFNENSELDIENLDKVILEAQNVVHIPNKVLHRTKAIKDTLIFEVSTPHPNDVIRVEDDKQRGNNRVQEEHGA